MIPLLLLLLAAPASAAAPAAAAYGIVVDNSGGFRGSLNAAIAAGQALAAASGPDDHGFIIRYVSADKIEILRDFGSSRADLSGAFDDLYSEPGKPTLFDALVLAADHLSEPASLKKAPAAKRALVLIASGEDGGSFISLDKLVMKLRKLKTRVFVLGYPSDAQERKVLERLAKETGGRAYFPAAAKETENAAKEIMVALRR